MNTNGAGPGNDCRRREAVADDEGHGTKAEHVADRRVAFFSSAVIWEMMIKLKNDRVALFTGSHLRKLLKWKDTQKRRATSRNR